MPITNEPKTMAKMASRLPSLLDHAKCLLCYGGTYQVSPNARIVLPVCQLWMLIMSLNQYPNIVCRLLLGKTTGVMSRSILLHVPGGAQLDSCFGRTHASVVSRLRASSLIFRDRDISSFDKENSEHAATAVNGRKQFIYSAACLLSRQRWGIT